MPIKVTCPNAECARTITVRDEMAGKAGKCPSCGEAITIPSRGKAGPRASRARDEDDDRDDEDEEEEEEEDVDDEDEEAALARRLEIAKEKARAAENISPTLPSTIWMLSVGCVFLILLSIMPFFKWFYYYRSITLKKAEQVESTESVNRTSETEYDGDEGRLVITTKESRTVKATGKTTDRDSKDVVRARSRSGYTLWSKETETPEESTREVSTTGVGTSVLPKTSYTILAFSICVIVFIAIVFSLAASGALEPKLANKLLAWAIGIGAAWGVIALFWTFGYSWKIVRLWFFENSMLKEQRLASDNPKDFKGSASCLPHYGLLLAMFCATAAVITFSVLCKKRRQRTIMSSCNMIGMAVGSIVLIFYIQPWSLILGGEKASMASGKDAPPSFLFKDADSLKGSDDD